MKINIKDVARKAGVSTATVSRVLGDFSGVRDKTRKKVLKAVTELNYEINAVARSLRQKKTNSIGIIVGNVLSQFYSVIAKSVEDTANKFGYHTILCNGDENPEKELEYLKVLKSNRVDGIILTPTGAKIQNMFSN
jgi:DNA-binding LacI/PurR family transcriptional regulator